MKKNTIISVTLVSFLTVACGGGTRAINPNAPVDIRKNGIMYSQEGEALDRADMKIKLNKNPASADDMRVTRAYGVAGTLFSITGGALTGIPLGQAATGQDAMWALAGVGAGMFLLLGMPFAIASDERVEKAVICHNESLKNLSLPRPRTVTPYFSAIPEQDGKGGSFVGGFSLQF